MNINSAYNKLLIEQYIESNPTSIYELFENLEDEMMDALMGICVLTFSSANSKLGTSVATFSLPAGWTCPFANKCLKKVYRDKPKDGSDKYERGKDAEFDCYAANQELQYDAVRANRWHNKDLLDEAGKDGGWKAQADLIERSLKFFFDTDGKKEAVRIHESGDFYSGEYLRAWMEVAKRMPKTKFYAYTKSVPFINKFKDQLGKLDNLSVTLSRGGKKDKDMDKVDVKEVEVFNTPEEALKAGMLIDFDDDLAKAKGGKESNFGLLVHGTQKAGEQSKNKRRNETFQAYWKYRKQLNRFFKKKEDHQWSTEEAEAGKKVIDKLISSDNKKFKKPDLEFKKKLLNYVIKYNKYDFDPKLINIVPKKYR